MIDKKQEWKEKGFQLKYKEKRKIDFILVTGKISICRSVFQIMEDIDLEKFHLKSKLIVPLDEYLANNLKSPNNPFH